MKLSKRLQAVADMITPGNSLADIGTDHGYIPIYMAYSGKTSLAIAMDVNQGPLTRAIQNIERYKVQSLVQTRLSDGLQGLVPGEVETIVIAGMGGLLTIRILTDGMELARSVKEIILSPHSDIHLVREFLVHQNYFIQSEDMVFDEGKYYWILKITPGHMESCEDEFLHFGGFLLQEKHPVLKGYLLKELDKRNLILQRLIDFSEENADRIAEVNQEINRISEALKHYEY